MISKLPLELQLSILELAIPSLAPENLIARRALLQTFSLVHRSWTRTAQRFLFSHSEVDLAGAPSAQEAERAAFRRREAFVVETLGLIVSGTVKPDWEESEVFGTVLQGVERARITVEEDCEDLPGWLISSLTACTSLEIVGRSDDPALPLLTSLRLPPNLTALKLSHLSFEEIPFDGPLPLIDCLYVDGVLFTDDPNSWGSEILEAVPNLETLGWRSTSPAFKADLLHRQHVRNIFFSETNPAQASPDVAHMNKLRCMVASTSAAQWAMIRFALGQTYTLALFGDTDITPLGTVFEPLVHLGGSLPLVRVLEEGEEPMQLDEWRPFPGV
ncbi:hypothetical protein JCM10449v2_005722 [Rhodotorula kratochvilovae]